METVWEGFVVGPAGQVGPHPLVKDVGEVVLVHPLKNHCCFIDEYLEFAKRVDEPFESIVGDPV